MMMARKRIAALSLAAALTLALAGCGTEQGQGDASAQNTPAGVAVQVEEVAQQTVATENRVSGRVEADGETSIFVASSVKCTAVYVQAGDTVSAGQKLCTLDLDSTLASYNAASISYDSAVQSYQDQQAILDKQVQLAQDNLDNLKALFEIGAASQLEIDQAELTLQQAQAGRASTLAQLEAGMQSAKSGVEQLATLLEDVDAQGNVVAPVAGTLTSFSATENAFTSPTMPLAVIDGPEQMKITASVSEALVPKLASGAEAEVTVSAAGAAFTGEIVAVERTANVQTRLYPVTLSIPADVGGLLSGMSAQVVFRTDASENAVVVPTQAILTSGEERYVFVVENDTAKYVPVTVGLTGSGVTEITSGLQPGQQLVTVGQAYLSDGDPVRVVSGEG